MKIDAHVHIGNLPGSDKVPFEAIRDRMLREMAENRVDGAVVIQRRHKDGQHSPSDAKLFDLVRGIPQLRVVATMNPVASDVSQQYHALQDLLSSGQVAGIKLYLGYQPFYPADSVCEPVYGLAAEYGVPVIFHTGDVFCTVGDEQLKYAQPLAVDEVATRHPNVNFIIAHIGNPWITDCAAVLYKNANVYADVSGLFVAYNGRFPTGAYQALLRQRIIDLIAYAGADRLLYGTDWPIAEMELYQKFFSDQVAIPAANLDSFWGGNAARLFRFNQ